jgi:hypothetical protein
MVRRRRGSNTKSSAWTAPTPMSTAAAVSTPSAIHSASCASASATDGPGYSASTPCFFISDAVAPMISSVIWGTEPGFSVWLRLAHRSFWSLTE